jgi:hypothetical protein
MTSFAHKCIPWVNALACSPKMAMDFSILCKVFLALTCIVGVLFSIVTLRRLYINRESKSSLFVVISLQLMVWAPMQIFYLALRAFSNDCFKVHPSFTITMNLLSSMILGNTIPRLIISWVEISQQQLIFRSGLYQKQYWITIAILTSLTTLSTALSGVSPTYYFAWMRVTLAIWITYLFVCLGMLFWFGVKLYRQLSVKNMEHDATASRARLYIRIVLISFGSLLVIVIVAFILYATFLETIEKSSVWPLLIWSLFKVGSICFVLFWTSWFVLKPPIQ